jgi:hypothetical protein
MSDYIVLRKTTLSNQQKTAGRTRHIVMGTELPAPAALEVAKYPDDPGYYLFYLDDLGCQMSDTYHSSLEEALDQAKWEFGVDLQDWITTE